MKKVRLNDLEENKNNLLKQYKLDKDSIKEFRSKIKQVSDEESKKLFFDLYDLITSKEFYDDYLKVTELIYNGAIVNYYSKNYDLFDICIRNNYIKTLIVLLRSGLDIGAFNFNQMSPIMLCSKVGNKEILELLILMGADVNLKNEYGDTALSLALENDHMECANILINTQAHLNSEFSRSNLNYNDNQSSLNNQPMNLIKELEEKFCSIENISKSFDDCKMNLLTAEQIAYQLDFFETYGCSAAITDFAILLGGFVSPSDYTKDGNNIANRTGWWWTKTPFNDDMTIVGCGGILGNCYLYSHSGGIRPILPFSAILTDCSLVDNRFDIKEVLFGEYPQYVADLQTAKTLELNYKVDCLNETGKNYTINYMKFLDNDNVNSFTTLKEYEYKGNKYIRFVTDLNCEYDTLSDGRHICVYSPYWIKVEPISWLVDEKNNIALSKRLLISGIPFRSILNDKTNYENTFIYKFLNEIFAKDIVPSKVNNKQLIKK